MFLVPQVSDTGSWEPPVLEDAMLLPHKKNPTSSLVQVRNSLLRVVICWPVARQNFLTLNTIPTFTCGIQKSVYMYMSVPQFHLHDFIIMSPLRTKRDIVFVWFFLLLLLNEACPDHNFLSFQIGQLYLVCGCMTIRWCVTYRNDLRRTLTFGLKVK